MDFAKVLHLLHVTVLPLVPWKPPSLTAESPTKKVGEAQNAAGDFPRMGWVISRKGVVVVMRFYYPALGQCRSQIKEGLRLTCA